MDRKAEISGCDKVLRRLTNSLKPLGFYRTKPTYFTRLCDYSVEFGHIHKFTFGPYFRVHFGIRVLVDSSESVALNGPDSDRIRNLLYFLVDHRKYNFEYGESLTSIEKCVKDILVFWKKVGEPWFKKWKDHEKLLKSNKSPLSSREKETLTKALQDSAFGKSTEITRRLLGFS